MSIITSFMLQLIAPTTLTALSAHTVFQRLRGISPSIGHSIALGFRRIRVAIGIIGVIFGPLMGLVLPLGILDLVGNHELLVQAGDLVSSKNLAILLIVCWVLMYVLVFQIAIPIAVVEGAGVLASLRRSAVLTSGYRTSICGMILVIAIFTGLIDFLATGIAADLTSSRLMVIQIILDHVGASLSCTVPIVIYYELREAREGAEPSALIDAFD